MNGNNMCFSDSHNQQISYSHLISDLFKIKIPTPFLSTSFIKKIVLSNKINDHHDDAAAKDVLGFIRTRIQYGVLDRPGGGRNNATDSNTSRNSWQYQYQEYCES